jgi:hypothetical protein
MSYQTEQKSARFLMRLFAGNISEIFIGDSCKENYLKNMMDFEKRENLARIKQNFMFFVRKF